MPGFRSSYGLFQECHTKKICEFMKCFAILLNVRKVLVANLVLLVERSEER